MPLALPGFINPLATFSRASSGPLATALTAPFLVPLTGPGFLAPAATFARAQSGASTGVLNG